jgi:acylphosphatase
VQDVGCRLFLLEAAEQLGLVGFQAKNMEDYVECIVEGRKAELTSLSSLQEVTFPSLQK